MLRLIPEQLLAGEAQTRLRMNPYPATQLPKVKIIKMPCRVALDIRIDMKALIELREEHSLGEH